MALNPSGLRKTAMEKWEKPVRQLESELKKEHSKMVFKKYKPVSRNLMLLKSQFDKAVKNRQFNYMELLGKWILESENGLVQSKQKEAQN